MIVQVYATRYHLYIESFGYYTKMARPAGLAAFDAPILGLELQRMPRNAAYLGPYRASSNPRGGNRLVRLAPATTGKGVIG